MNKLLNLLNVSSNPFGQQDPVLEMAEQIAVHPHEELATNKRNRGHEGATKIPASEEKNEENVDA